jgi:hypothetical protein
MSACICICIVPPLPGEGRGGGTTASTQFVAPPIATFPRKGKGQEEGER